jgi:CRP-like cAMP-binding protein
MAHTYILEQVDIFEDLTPSHLELIEEICGEKNYNQGDVVFEENTPSTRVDPDTIGDGTDSYEPTTIATLRRGQSFGEAALIDPGVRSASAQCTSETCRLLMIHRGDFLALIEGDYEMGYIVMRNFAVDLSVKIRQTNLIVREGLM